jgi:hypothetical protein
MGIQNLNGNDAVAQRTHPGDPDLKTRTTHKRRTYDKGAKRRGGPMPVKLSYDPLESGANMHRFLGDLITWTLQGKIWHRQAGVCRGIIETCLRVEGYEEVEGKMNEIEEELAATKNLHQQMERGPDEIVSAFILKLPPELQHQIVEYVDQQVKLEQEDKTK